MEPTFNMDTFSIIDIVRLRKAGVFGPSWKQSSKDRIHDQFKKQLNIALKDKFGCNIDGLSSQFGSAKS